MENLQRDPGRVSIITETYSRESVADLVERRGRIKPVLPVYTASAIVCEGRNQHAADG